MSAILLVVFVLGVIVSLALTAAPTVIGVMWAQRRIAWNRELLARAVRTRGTVVEVPTYISGGGQSSASLHTVPVVAYVAPDGTRRQARVRVASPSMYSYGQPVDLLVDPQSPDQVVLAAHADDVGRSNGMVVVSVILSMMIAGVMFILWLVGGTIVAGLLAASSAT